MTLQKAKGLHRALGAVLVGGVLLAGNVDGAGVARADISISPRCEHTPLVLPQDTSFFGAHDKLAAAAEESFCWVLGASRLVPSSMKGCRLHNARTNSSSAIYKSVAFVPNLGLRKILNQHELLLVSQQSRWLQGSSHVCTSRRL